MSTDATPAPAQDAIPIPPVPPRIADGEDYDRCLDLVGRDPQGAADAASAWIARGGGTPARHCEALSLIALGDPARAATLLDTLAADPAAAPSARAVIAGQAAQAWLLAASPTRALASADVAVSLDSDDPGLLLTHANAALASNQPASAIEDLDRVLALDPTRNDALVLRATAYRDVGDFGRASADVTAALAIDPDDPGALLERGILRQRAGDLDGARADWERAIALSPDTQTADAAQQDIALLEVGPDLR